MKTLALVLSTVVLLAGCKKGEDAAFEALTPPSTPQASLPKYWQVPDFTFTERSGRTMGRADLLGHVWLGAFVYTTCPGPCGLMTTRMATLDKALASKPDVRIVAFSLDPETDTPEVLTRYAAERHASERWLFFTGERPSLHKFAVEGLKLAVQDRQAGAEPIIHSTKLVLVDRQGVVRGLYEGTESTGNERVLADIERLRTEAP